MLHEQHILSQMEEIYEIYVTAGYPEAKELGEQIVKYKKNLERLNKWLESLKGKKPSGYKIRDSRRKIR